ncbi:MAG: ATP-binding cassette domain-containing protein [Mucilaginibacter sp.]
MLLNLDVKFILLDEPFSKVEPLYKQIIIDLIQEYRPTKGFIITDHDYINIIDASDKIILISNGVCRPIDKLFELEQYNYVPVGTFS